MLQGFPAVQTCRVPRVGMTSGSQGFKVLASEVITALVGAAVLLAQLARNVVGFPTDFDKTPADQ